MRGTEEFATLVQTTQPLYINLATNKPNISQMVDSSRLTASNCLVDQQVTRMVYNAAKLGDPETVILDTV